MNVLLGIILIFLIFVFVFFLFFATTKVCHKTCLECNDGSAFSCTKCNLPLFLHNGQCISSCPEGYIFSHESSLCEKCPIQCQTCESMTKCIDCAPNFNKILETNECVLACPYKYYADSYGICRLCDPSCATCNNPEICLSCPLENHSFLSSNGKCISKSCMPNEFILFDPQKNQIECKECDKKCAECIGDGPLNCTKCAFGFFELKTSSNLTIQCKTCSELNFGLYLSNSGKCEGIFSSVKKQKEICGDGINLGKLECDDGNLNDNDGCNKNCHIEEGYECNKQMNGPDICSIIKPLEANMEIVKGNIIRITFKRPVVSPISGIFLIVLIINKKALNY